MNSAGNGEEFRRVATVVAALAVVFFLPSLPLANVPRPLWLEFIASAGVAAFILAGSFFSTARSSEMAVLIGIVDAVVVVLLGALYRGYYNEIPLLFLLVVAALAVVHGLTAALPAVVVGALLVPTVIEPAASWNATDIVNAGIYLLGGAVVPWVAARLALRRSHALRRQLKTTRSLEREAVLVLARAAEAKDEVTGEHVARVGHLAATLARAAGTDANGVEAIRFAAMLHDVGKLHVPDRILLKPGRLTSAEWEIMRKHTIWGEQILGDTAGFELARTICRSHHENWDGSGYPDGLRAGSIPLEARIVRITDTFDALRSVRPYKQAWPVERCLEELERSRELAFDPELVRVFIPLAEKLFADELAGAAKAAVARPLWSGSQRIGA